MMVSFEVIELIITLLPQEILFCTITENLHLENMLCKELMVLGWFVLYHSVS